MSQGRYGLACRKLAESHRVEAALGTLLNLATCNEADGKPGTAWSQYVAAKALADSTDDAARAQYADERLADLRTQITTLQVKLPGNLPPAAEVRLNDQLLDQATLADGVYLPAGDHTLAISAPGRRPRLKQYSISGGPRALHWDVPPLQQLASSASIPEVVDVEGQTEAKQSALPWFVAGTTVALTGAAIWTGIDFLQKRNNFHELNAEESASLEDKRQLRDDANNAAVLNGVFAVAAVVGAGVTTYLFITDSEAPEAAATPNTSWSAWFDSQAGGILVNGDF